MNDTLRYVYQVAVAKNKLVENLNLKGVSASISEPLVNLVNKILLVGQVDEESLIAGVINIDNNSVSSLLNNDTELLNYLRDNNLI